MTTYYLAEKNARRHRRNAKLITAFITLTLLVAFSYYAGLLDPYLGAWLTPDATNVGPTA